MGWLDIFDPARLFGRKSDPAYSAYVQFLGAGAPVYTPKNYTAMAKEGHEKNITVYRAISLIAQSCAGIPWKLYQEGNKLREVTDSPLLDLIKNPNPRYSSADFFEEVISYWLISGNSYITGVRPSPNAVPYELWTLRPDRMNVVPGVSSIAGYEYIVNGQRSFFQARDVLHMRMFSATDDWYGLSPVVVAGALVDQQNEGFDWNTALLQNAGRPSGALVSTGALGNDQYDRLRRIIRERYTGKRNAGTPMLLEGGLDWKPFSMSPLELDWGKSRTINARDIAIALGVPPELLGDNSNKTYSNYQEARKSFYQETVLPLMDRLRDRMNVWLVSQFGKGLLLDYDKDDIEALQEDRDSISNRMIAQWNAGLITMNEARESMGYDEVTGGDIYQLQIAKSIYIPDSSLVEAVEQKLENLLAPPMPAPAPPGAPTQLPDTDSGPQDTGTQQSAESSATTAAQNQQKPAAPKKPVAKYLSPGAVKAANALYNDLEKRANEKLVVYFTEEQQRVVKAAKRAAVPATIEIRVSQELDKCAPLLEETLLAIYEDASSKSYEATSQSLASGKAIGIFSGGGKFFKKLAKKIAALVHAATKEEIGHAIAYGTVKGEGVRQIGDRIGAIYDSEVKTTRAQRIAITEANAAANRGAIEAAQEASNYTGFPITKQWVTMGDGHVRKAHAEAEGEIADLDEPFVVGGEELLYPGDDSLGASAGNIINCRCKLVYMRDELKGLEIFVDGVRIAKPDGGGGSGSGSGGGAAKVLRVDEKRENIGEVISALAGGQEKWRNSLSDNEEKVLHDYTMRDFGPINRILRQGFEPTFPGEKEQLVQKIAQIQHSLESAYLPASIVVYRGLDGEDVVAKSFFEQKIGKVMQDKGFVSTTIDPVLAKEFGQGRAQVVMEITIPKGTKAAYVAPLSYSPHEREVLLPLGTKFRVNAVQSQDGKTVVHATVIASKWAIIGAVEQKQENGRHDGVLSKFMWGLEDILWEGEKTWNKRELGEIAALQEVLAGCTKELVFECSFTGNDIEDALRESCKALLRVSLAKIHPAMPFEKIINHTLAPYIAEHVQRIIPATSQIRQSTKSVLAVQTQDIAPWLYQFAQEANEARAHNDGGSKVVEGKRLEKPGSGGSSGGGGATAGKIMDEKKLLASEAFKSFSQGQYDAATNTKSNGYELLHRLAQEQHFTGKPSIVSESELAKFAANGETELLRGYSPGKPYAEAFRNGEYRAGNGIFGNGMYTASAAGGKEWAETMGNAYDEANLFARGRGVVSHMTLKAGSKVGDYGQIKEEADVAAKQYDSQLAAIKTKIAQTSQNSPQQTALMQQEKKLLFLQAVSKDVGSYAASKGYDAYHVSQYDMNGLNAYSATHTVILNRTAVRVSPENLQGASKW